MKLSRLLAFAAVGVAAGLLLSTKKGKALRGDVMDAAGTLAKRLQSRSEDLLARSEDVLAEAKSYGKSAKKAVSEYTS